MMKIRCRKNLLYLLIYYISAFIVSLIGNAIDYKYGFNPLYACIYLYPFENILGGLVVYLYQYNSTRKKEKVKYFGIELLSVGHFIIWATFFDQWISDYQVYK